MGEKDSLDVRMRHELHPLAIKIHSNCFFSLKRKSYLLMLTSQNSTELSVVLTEGYRPIISLELRY
jgi:hypothetical protein